MRQIIQNLNKFEDKPAIIWHDHTYTYGWLRKKIGHFQHTLEQAGIPDGSIVTIESGFSPGAVAIFFALATKNCVVAPLSTSHKAEAGKLCKIAQTEYRLAPPQTDAPDDTANVSSLKFEKTDLDAEHEIYRSLRQQHHPGLILFSSGSTGEPKGIVHDLQLLAQRFDKPRKPYRAVAFLLFDHIGGINTMLYLLSSGGCLVVLPDRSPETVLQTIEKHRVQLLPTSPTFLNMIIASEAYKQYDLSSLQVISYGAEPMPEGTLRKIHELFPDVRLQQTYGLSEVGILSTKSKSSDSLWLKAGGKGYETKVVDGILHIRAETAMLGYLNAPSPFSEDGWLNTGDAVEVNGEYIRFRGRQDEQINVGGEKVSPTEVESVLEAMDEIQQALVFGEKNPLMGAVVSARIVPAPGATVDPAALRKSIRQHCQNKLPRYKVPVRIEIVSDIQHTERFKKKRRQKTKSDCS